ncbi:Suppressor of G2 allele of SKP1 [Cichlidogyrus casuarinus]|uniref:Suppressor of G2 allele of SKP1 n=1 Tax=Cichlidogyrus casuarinus TaxID=1844966 RepID=A0ABD2Q0Z5_9PLAT
MTTKLELHLTKVTFDRWNVLEGVDPMANLKGIDSKNDTADMKSYPSSCKVQHDWDKLAKEADEIDDRDPLNKLFQDIYGKAPDETKKAMIKSFTESNGTVLSTNWNEVGAKPVEMQPPDGMEYKNYEI